MKKYLSGFVPVDFRKLGKAFLLIGLVAIIIKGVEEIAGGFVISDMLFFIGAAMFLIGAYMVFTVVEK
jgi:hypothetical protein